MRTFLLPLIAGVTLSFSAQASSNDPVPAPLVMVKAKTVFAPVGFDDNDEAMVVLDGYLPNSCYKLAFNESQLDAATHTIKITQWARRFSGVCLDALVPFTSEMRLGALNAGKYTISVDGAQNEQLLVKTALNNGPDDYLYAPVDNARVEWDGSRYVATLTGRFTNSCIVWDGVKFIDSGKTLEVLPIIKKQDIDGCQTTETPFVKSLALPADMTPGRHLLHVRSLNGQAINVAFTVASSAD